MKMFEWLFLGIFAFVGLIFAVVGFLMERHDTRFVQNAEPVTVRVVELHESTSRRDGRTSTTYRPEFEVVSGPNEGQRHISRTGQKPPVHQIGYQGPGFYDPSSGRIASEVSAQSNARLMRIFSSVGLGLLLIPLIYWVRTHIL